MNILKYIMSIFQKEEDTITFGEPDENNLSTLYRNGQKTNCRIYVMPEEQYNRLRKIHDELIEEHWRNQKNL